MSGCAEHEALLTEALERVKRLEEALRALMAGVEGHMVLSPSDTKRLGEIWKQCETALRPEGT